LSRSSRWPRPAATVRAPRSIEVAACALLLDQRHRDFDKALFGAIGTHGATPAPAPLHMRPVTTI